MLLVLPRLIQQLDLKVRRGSRAGAGGPLAQLHLDVHGAARALGRAPALELLPGHDVEVPPPEVQQLVLARPRQLAPWVGAQDVAAVFEGVALGDQVFVVAGLEEADQGAEGGEVGGGGGGGGGGAGEGQVRELDGGFLDLVLVDSLRLD